MFLMKECSMTKVQVELCVRVVFGLLGVWVSVLGPSVGVWLGSYHRLRLTRKTALYH